MKLGFEALGRTVPFWDTGAIPWQRAGSGPARPGAADGPAAQSQGRGRRHPRRDEAGAATIEFAFALMFILLFFIAYVKISEIFLAHSRLRYATFVASRVHAVGGSAEKAASEIDEDYKLKTTSDNVSMEKTLDLPKAIGTLFGTGESFTISHSVKTFKETTPSGDNAAK